MEYITLKKLVDRQLSTYEIAKESSCSQTNIRYWLKVHNLKTFIPPKLSKKQKYIKATKTALDKRRELKIKAVQYKGGECIICGYYRCTAALDFHHRDPKEKEFLITKSYRKNWEKIKKELDKCDLLCSNCHREFHYNN